MADVTGAHHPGEHSSSSSDGTPPNHLGTQVPGHNLDGNHDPEKSGLHDHAAAKPAKPIDDDDEEDEDIDALIDDLESQDGGIAEEEEEEETAGGTPPISEDFLQTSTRTGLTEAEVVQRRKKFGPNQMKEEKENLILKFLGYFVGPIQFVMEVRSRSIHSQSQLLRFRFIFSNWGIGSHHRLFYSTFCQEIIALTTVRLFCNRLLPFSLQVFKIGSTSVSSVLCYYLTLLSVSSKNSRPALLSTNSRRLSLLRLSFSVTASSLSSKLQLLSLAISYRLKRLVVQQ